MVAIKRSYTRRRPPKQKHFTVIECKGKHSEYNHEFDNSVTASDYADVMERRFPDTVWIVCQNCP